MDVRSLSHPTGNGTIGLAESMQVELLLERRVFRVTKVPAEEGALQLLRIVDDDLTVVPFEDVVVGRIGEDAVEDAGEATPGDR